MLKLHKFVCNKTIENKLQFLRLCSNAGSKGSAYTATVNLPTTNFRRKLKAEERSEVERNINENLFKQLYQWQRENVDGKEFILHDGPPYANGDLHMGHAVNKILKDIVLRGNIINGRKVHYVPGWDCHGLPIELKAMGKDESKADALTIRQKARGFALQTLDKQKAEFASWGVTADWSDAIYRTLDPPYIRNQLKMFYDLCERNLVYRALKPVYWSPSSKTALAEAELEYNPKFPAQSLLLRLKMLKYPKSIHTTDNVYALIWTTTPWSVPSNQAICFHPGLEYCTAKLKDRDGFYIVAKSLVERVPSLDHVVASFSADELHDCSYNHPINGDSVLSLYPGHHVDAAKGTGLVHIAPAHGHDDFLIGLKHKLATKCFVDEEGNYTADAPEFLRFKSVLRDGSDLVLNHVADNVIESQKTFVNYPMDWRTKQPIIIRTSKQWFINTDRLKASALDEISKVKIYPLTLADANRKNLTNQLERRPYWCISRQRVWGTPIPVFYAKDTGVEIVNKDVIEHLCGLLETEGSMDFWWKKTAAEMVPQDIWAKHNIDPNNVVKGQDILDIWFDSGISWMTVLNPPQVADLYLEGVDQFTGWFQSSLMTSVALRGHAPFKTVFAHGFTVDEKGRKMSKSLGNVVHPKHVVAKYGADTLRWFVAAHGSQNASIIVSDGQLTGDSNTVVKIRNTLRFMVGCLESERTVNDLNFDTTALYNLDKYFLNELVEFDDKVTKALDQYQFSKVVLMLQDFIINQLSTGYFVHCKDRFYCGTKQQRDDVRNVIRSAFYVTCKALWPIMPFTIEECWSYHDKQPFYQFNFDIPANWKEPKYRKLWNICLDCKEILRQTVPDGKMWTQDVHISASLENVRLLQQMHEEFMERENSSECEILQVQSITLWPNDNNDFITISSDTIDDSLCPRCRRFALNHMETVCERCENVMNENAAAN